MGPMRNIESQSNVSAGLTVHHDSDVFRDGVEVLSLQLGAWGCQPDDSASFAAGPQRDALFECRVGVVTRVVTSSTAWRPVLLQASFLRVPGEQTAQGAVLIYPGSMAMLVGLPLARLQTDAAERVLPTVTMWLATPELDALRRMLCATASTGEAEVALSSLVDCDRDWRTRCDAGGAQLIWQPEVKRVRTNV